MTSPYNTEREKWISSARKKKLSELRSRNDKSVEDFRDNLEKEVVNILEKCQNQVRDFKEKVARMNRLSTARQQKRRYLHLQEQQNNITPDKRIRLEEKEDIKLCDALEEAEKMYLSATLSTSNTYHGLSESPTTEEALDFQQRNSWKEQPTSSFNNSLPLVGDINCLSTEIIGSSEDGRSNAGEMESENENDIFGLLTSGQLSYLETPIRQQEQLTHRGDGKFDENMLKGQLACRKDLDTDFDQTHNQNKTNESIDAKCSPSIIEDEGLTTGRNRKSSVAKSTESNACTNTQKQKEIPHVPSNIGSSLLERFKQSAATLVPDLLQKVKQEPESVATKTSVHGSEINETIPDHADRRKIKEEPSDVADRPSLSAREGQSNGINPMQNPTNTIKQESSNFASPLERESIGGLVPQEFHPIQQTSIKREPFDPTVPTIDITDTDQILLEEQNLSKLSVENAPNMKNAKSDCHANAQTKNVPTDGAVGDENSARAMKPPNPRFKSSRFRGGELPDWLMRSPPRPLSVRHQREPLPAGQSYTWIFFDMQTTEYGEAMEILQLAAMVGDKAFTRYVMPKHTTSVTSTTNLAKYLCIKGDRLMKDGQVLDTISIEDCLKEFSDWLKQFQNPVLVPYNAYDFDAKNLCRCIVYALDDDDASIARIEKPTDFPLGYAIVCKFVSSQIVGFSDIKNMHEAKFRGKSVPHRLHFLLNDFTNPEFDTHDSLANVKALQSLCSRLNFTDEEFRNASFTFEHAFCNMQVNELLNIYKRSLYPMVYKEKCLSIEMAKKFAGNGVSFQHLLNEYRSGGIFAVDLLLGGYEKGTVKITRTKRIINTVCEYMQRYVDGLVYIRYEDPSSNE